MTARLGTPKTGGRKKGSLDRAERVLISEKMAADILKVYKRLGPDWLFEVAKTRPDLFISQCLSKILPPVLKDPDADITLNQQINHYSDARGIAQRVAFALSLGLQQQADMATPVAERVEPQEPMTPQKACDWQTPCEPPLLQPEDNASKQRWIEELPLTDEGRKDAALIRETVESDITNYHGCGAEQGLSQGRQSSATTRKPTAAELTCRMSRRSELL
jgi:hypothetical protein